MRGLYNDWDGGNIKRIGCEQINRLSTFKVLPLTNAKHANKTKSLIRRKSFHKQEYTGIKQNFKLWGSPKQALKWILLDRSTIVFESHYTCGKMTKWDIGIPLIEYKLQLSLLMCTWESSKHWNLIIILLQGVSCERTLISALYEHKEWFQIQFTAVYIIRQGSSWSINILLPPLPNSHETKWTIDHSPS